MSQQAFQSALAKLVVDAEYRDRVLAEGMAALGEGLDERERRRLLAVAGDRGLDVTRTLYQGFRLAKVLARLPLTHRLLGDRVLAEALRGFWRRRPALSFYYLEEAIAFCDDLLTRGPQIPYLGDVVRYERAGLELQRPRVGGRPPAPQLVRFEHDPMTLIRALSAGEAPRLVPRRPCRWLGLAGEDQQVRWHQLPDGEEAGAAGGEAVSGTEVLEPN